MMKIYREALLEELIKKIKAGYDIALIGRIGIGKRFLAKKILEYLKFPLNIVVDFRKYFDNYFAIAWSIIRQYVASVSGNLDFKYRLTSTSMMKETLADLGENIAIEWIDFLIENQNWASKSAALMFINELPQILKKIQKNFILIYDDPFKNLVFVRTSNNITDKEKYCILEPLKNNLNVNKKIRKMAGGLPIYLDVEDETEIENKAINLIINYGEFLENENLVPIEKRILNRLKKEKVVKNYSLL